MDRATAERRAFAIHNAKCFLVTAKEHTNLLSNAGDADAEKLFKDLSEAITLLTNMEYDMDKIPHTAVEKKGKVKAK